MRKSQLVAMIILAATLGLAACGQKGPLYLPEDQLSSAQDKTPATGEANTEEKAKATQ